MINDWDPHRDQPLDRLCSCNLGLRPTQLIRVCSGDECRGGGRVVFECRWDLLLCFAVVAETMDMGFDQDQLELGVLVFPVCLEVLANSNSLLHEVPEVLGNAGCKSYVGVSGCRLVMSC